MEEKDVDKKEIQARSYRLHLPFGSVCDKRICGSIGNDPRLVLVLQPDTSAIPAQDDPVPPGRPTPKTSVPETASPGTPAGMSPASNHATDAADPKTYEPNCAKLCR